MERGVKNALKIMRNIALLVLCVRCAQAQSQPHPLLRSGPMLGYVDMMEALLWVQTTEQASVRFAYWETSKPNIRYHTDSASTEKRYGYTAKCIADQVKPGRQYTYQLLINGSAVSLPYPTTFATQSMWQGRGDAPDFTVATGSCFYINEPEYDRPDRPFNEDYRILEQINRQKPNLMIWLGDNTYLREPDWNSRTGMLHRYTHTRSIPALQPLLAATHHLAIWDDHDYGPNDADGTFIHKETAWEVFGAFWGNPTFGLPGQKGCSSFFEYSDVDFFLLDDMYYRTPNRCDLCPDRSMLGKAQLEWLKGALEASRAPFKIVCVGTQVLNTNTEADTYNHFFPAERDSLLAFIEKEGVKNVVFLTGDRHFAELSALQNARGHWVYDISTSPLMTKVSAEGQHEQNRHRVPGTLVSEHNFALLKFTGPRQERKMEISILNKEGQTLWTRVVTTQK
jgi:alkaline phosphatase D